MRKGMLVSCMALVMMAYGSTAKAAYTDNFDEPTYAEGILVGQNGWTTTTGNVSNYPIYADELAFPGNEGKLYAEHRNPPGLRNASKTIAPIGPGGDGKIYMSVDCYLGGGSNPATVMSHLMLRDANNLELFRFDVKPSGIRGRLQGGGGVVSSYVMVDGVNPIQRTIWAVVDTAYSLGGVGGSVDFYMDSISAPNLISVPGAITYPADRLDAIGQVWVDSTDGTGTDFTDYVYLDNIFINSAVPEPGTLGLLLLGALPFLRRRVAA